MSDLKIGDTLYRFDGNRRIYKAPQRGPIFSEHFVADRIVSDTPKSWITAAHYKVNKKTLLASGGTFGHTKFFTEQGKEDVIWTKEHHWKLKNMMDGATADQLKQIAVILGYTGD